MVYRLTRLWDVSQTQQEKACEGFESRIARDVYAVLHGKVADAGGAVEFDLALRGRRNLGLVIFIPDLAHNLLEHVFDSDPVRRWCRTRRLPAPGASGPFGIPVSIWASGLVSGTTSGLRINERIRNSR